MFFVIIINSAFWHGQQHVPVMWIMCLSFVVWKKYLNGGNFEMKFWSCTDFYAPLEKGGILFCNCLSVGRSVCRSVDQVLSGQYLLTPSLDQYQTWCRGCPQWVYDPYWFSGHMLKGQGQTTLLSLRFSAQRAVTLIFFYPSLDPFTAHYQTWCRGCPLE